MRHGSVHRTLRNADLSAVWREYFDALVRLLIYIFKTVRNSYRDGLNGASANYYREPIETADHKTMFQIMDSLICSRASTVHSLSKTIDRATLPNIFIFLVQDVRKTLPLCTLNDDVCAVLPSFDSFRALSYDKVKHVIDN